MAFGMYFWSSSVRYFGKAHLGNTVDGPEVVKTLIILMSCKSKAIYEEIKSMYKKFNIPASSGPGINRNLLCSFSLGCAAIIFPRFPNCNLQL